MTELSNLELVFSRMPITSNKVVLFDGVCNLCNSSVQTLIKYDKKDVFKFASLQGGTGKALLGEGGLETKDFKTNCVH